MIIYANAKINLRLEVLTKEENGYHKLLMVNARLKDLFDEITIEESSFNSVTYSTKVENNVALRMIEDFKKIYNIDKCYKIHINKKIPIGSGLGGGSMDIAAIYQYLLDDNKIDLNNDKKIKFIKKYGADCPYGLFKKISIVEGYGEIVTPLDAKINDYIYIIVPKIQVLTKDVFNSYDEKYSKSNIRELKNSIYNNEYSSILYNDLERTTFTMYPEIRQIKDELTKYGHVIMSGSGSSLVLIPNDPKIDVKLPVDNVKIYKTMVL